MTNPDKPGFLEIDHAQQKNISESLGDDNMALQGAARMRSRSAHLKEKFVPVVSPAVSEDPDAIRGDDRLPPSGEHEEIKDIEQKGEP